VSGVLGSAITGTGGVILTLHIAPRLTPLAFAELALGFVAAVLITARGRAPVNGEGKRERNSGDRKHTAGEPPP
jgi:hypothetical protein